MAVQARATKSNASDILEIEADISPVPRFDDEQHIVPE